MGRTPPLICLADLAPNPPCWVSDGRFSAWSASNANTADRSVQHETHPGCLTERLPTWSTVRLAYADTVELHVIGSDGASALNLLHLF